MKIRILGVSERINKDVDTYLKVLDASEIFWQLVELARKESGIPQDGYTNLNHNMTLTMKIPKDQIEGLRTLITNSERFTPLLDNSMALVRILGLPSSWLNAIMTIIILNYVTPPNSHEEVVSVEFIQPIFTKKVKSQNHFDSYVTITINEKMSIGEIKNQITKQKKQLEKYLSLLPKAPSQLSWVNKIKNIDIKIKIDEYKKAGFSLRQIRAELEKEYGENTISFELSKSQLSTYQKRFKSLVNNIIDNKPMLSYFIESKKKSMSVS